ncbi:MAG: tetratricopeptide repeat protein [Acidobacteriota bacterium]|nr:tetratricopeptide repeat protein [Acidobacteriota bacterium]
MNKDQWQIIQNIVEQALELSGDARDQFLAAQFQGESTIRVEVEKLLAVEADDMAFMEQPVMQLEIEEGADPPERVGPYHILGELGRGGMGTVYLARREGDETGKQVALKILKRGMDTDELVRRFHNERKILASLDHPHIARLIEGASTADGRPYFVMEYVDGEPITRWCDSRRLNLDARIELFRKVCRAVHFAHRNLVIHRDIKPSNILVTAEGEPKLLDFGIARLMKSDTDTTLFRTKEGNRLLTPDYASPEQILNQPLTTASDIYSLGLLLYELLTGRHPFRHNTGEGEGRLASESRMAKPSSVVLRAMERRTGETVETIAPERLSEVRALDPRGLRRRLSGDLDTVVLHALRREPERRYASAEQFEEDLGRLQNGYPVHARPESIFYSLRKLVGRHPVAFSAAAATLFAGVILVSLLVQQSIEARLATRRGDTLNNVMFSMLSYVDGYVARDGKIDISDFLDHMFQDMEKALADEPELQANALDTLGMKLIRAGEINSALTVLKRADVLWSDKGRQDSVMTGRIRLHLGEALTQKEYYEKAAEHLEHSLGLFQRHGDDFFSAMAMTGLALTHFYRSRYEQADDLYKQSLAIQERIGSRTEDYGRTLNHHAENQMRMNQFDEVEKTLAQADTFFKETNSTRHVLYAETLSLIGRLAYLRGDLKKGISYYEQSLVLLDSLVDESHPTLGIILNNLSILYQEAGDFPNAISGLKRGIRIGARQYDPNTQMMFIIESQLARAYLKADLPELALPILEDLYRREMPDIEGVSKRRYLLTAYIADAYHRLGRSDRAETFYLKSLQHHIEETTGFIQALGYWNLALFYLDIGRPQKARPHLDHLNARYESDWQLIAANGRAAMLTGRIEEGEALFKTAHEGAQKTDDKAEIHHFHALALQSIQRFEEALAHNTQALAYREEQPAQVVKTNKALSLRADLFKALGRTQDEAEVRARLSLRKAEVQAAPEQTLTNTGPNR